MVSEKFFIPTTGRPCGSIISCTDLNIIDIRRGIVEHSIVDDIYIGLSPGKREERTLPTLLLYNETGLKLFEDITYLDEYYLTNAEIRILDAYADRIAHRIQPGSVIVELGSGNLRKVNILLQALEKIGRNVEYYALDLSRTELERTLSTVTQISYKHVKICGLHGTYDDGLEWLQSPPIAHRPKSIFWLGSSIGNFKRDDAAAFLGKFADILKQDDHMLIGIDGNKDPSKVYKAYNDPYGVTRHFILNGLSHANYLLGSEVFKLGDWEYIGEYDALAGCHQAFVAPLKDTVIDSIKIRRGERVRIEESYKYSPSETEQLWEATGLVEGAKWSDENDAYALHLVYKPKVAFKLQPEQYAAQPVPDLQDWSNLWVAWDFITQEMVPKNELLSKPIKLRNALIFYLGHIPTFLDIQLTRATNGVPTEPRSYPTIFERGIDPDVDNPGLCHAHSEIPDTWPPLDEILDFQTRVRARVQDLYASGATGSSLQVGRALWMGFEHEAMHLETFLYMLVQSEKTLPPPGTVIPDFKALAVQATKRTISNEWIIVRETDVTLGLDNDRDDFGPSGHFGWDNETPRRTVHVRSFAAQARPITNGEYANYISQTGSNKLPASWCDSIPMPKDDGYDGGIDMDFIQFITIKTVYGKVPLKYALYWPVVASYDELAGYASWMNSRIPTMEEARSIYAHAERAKSKEVQKSIGRIIPAVNGHLVNNGVQESPPQKPITNAVSRVVPSQVSQDLFIDLRGTNIAFKHWHPMPVNHKGSSLCGQGDLGGVWEWTSTVLEAHKGFKATELYPGYTADFFDEKHNIVLGGSWATHPRIAGRKTFINWYQRNYPFAWAGARLVRDL